MERFGKLSFPLNEVLNKEPNYDQKKAAFHRAAADFFAMGGQPERCLFQQQQAKTHEEIGKTYV